MTPASPASPARIAAAVAALLAGHGLTRVYVAACSVIAVISVAAGLTAWTNGRLLWVTLGGQRETWPAADTEAAAARLAALARPAAPQTCGLPPSRHPRRQRPRATRPAPHRRRRLHQRPGPDQGSPADRVRHPGLYRSDMHQVTSWATLTDDTPGTITALLADPRTDSDTGTPAPDRAVLLCFGRPAAPCGAGPNPLARAGIPFRAAGLACRWWPGLGVPRAPWGRRRVHTRWAGRG